jgi:hypothetical protein
VHVVATPACVPLSLSVSHGGGRATAPAGSGSLADVSSPLAAGDVITIGCGGRVVSFAYDALPSIGPAACAGSRTINGGLSVGGMLILAVARPGNNVPYTRASQVATTIPAAGSYAGRFPRPLLATDVVRVDEFVRGAINGLLVDYYSIQERVAGACATAAAPRGSVALVHRRPLLPEFLHRGLATRVSDDQPGTVVENLYLDDGAPLPAHAARRTRKPTPIGRGSATITKAGKVTLTVRPNASGRRLSPSHSVRALLLTTLRNRAGASRTLAVKRITLAR